MIDRSGHNKKRNRPGKWRPREGPQSRALDPLLASGPSRLRHSRGRSPAEVAGDPLPGLGGEPRKSHELAAVKIEVPVVPPTFIALGSTTPSTCWKRPTSSASSADLPTQPDVGYRAVNALIAHEEAVVIPAGAQKVQYEGELAVVIGKRARHLAGGRGALLRTWLHHRQ